MQCPECQREIDDPDAWGCPYCEHVFDSMVGDVFAGEESVLTEPRVEVTQDAEALILGQVDALDPPTIVPSTALLEDGRVSNVVLYATTSASSIIQPWAVP